ncbi:MAG TPA: multicopper oxidase domain-containing protein [Acidobacteriota bacterium]|nr:multicopper oxidase domain-containing protein [Acidobacteriota bacterium]
MSRIATTPKVRLLAVVLSFCLAVGWLQAQNCEGQNLLQPEIRDSENGRLDTVMTVAYAVNILGCDKVNLRNYEATLRPPTFKVKAGDRITMQLNNDLPHKDMNHPADPNVPHGFNITNFHTHGWHISPTGNSDNVLLELEPGQGLLYEFNLPDDHPAGTFWYHPHKHGSTAMQVASAMGGALIVEGGLDNNPQIAAAKDRIMILQQIPYELGDDGIGTIEDFAQLQGEYTRPTFVNGQVHPVIRMKPGEVQRWRFIQAGILELVHLSLQGHELNVIAWDGLATGSIDPHESVELAPGNRVDVLVKAGAPGTYQLMKIAEQPDQGLRNLPTNEELVATVVVEGYPVVMSLPNSAELAKYKPFRDIRPDQLQSQKDVVFAKNNSSTFFNINGVPFNPNEVPWQLKLGHYEQWNLSSDDQNHPFHIHVNPFMVVKIGDEELNPPRWMDTILVRKGKPVVFYTFYKRYIGSFVFHCHILNHEDQGMMRLVEIVP